MFLMILGLTDEKIIIPKRVIDLECLSCNTLRPDLLVSQPFLGLQFHLTSEVSFGLFGVEFYNR